MNTSSHEAVSVVLPVRNCAAGIEALVANWTQGLNSVGRPWELIVVDDGSTDGTFAKAEAAAARGRNTRVLKLGTATGFGACLRLALPEVQHPLLATCAADYPYTPVDLAKLQIGRAHV